MALTIDYSVATRVSDKNKAFAGIFQAEPESRQQAVESFVHHAKSVLKALEGEGSTPSYILNARDIKTQTEAILVTDRSNKAIREPLRDLARQFGIDLK